MCEPQEGVKCDGLLECVAVNYLEAKITVLKVFSKKPFSSKI